VSRPKADEARTGALAVAPAPDRDRPQGGERSSVTADVVVVGAGVLGASAAWHLRRLGAGRVVLVDPAPGSGSTARATGGYRATYVTADNVRLSLLARAALGRFHDETGVDPGLDEVGYLWLARTAAERARLEAALAVQRAAGLTTSRLCEPGEVAELNPALATADLCGGLFGASDGTLRPLELVRGYLGGAEVVRERAVGLLGDARVTGVQTTGGPVAAGAVVLALGAWTGAFARATGLDLPVEPLRRQVVAVAAGPLPAHMPLTIFLDDGFHLRVRDGHALLLRPTPGDPHDPFATTVEPSWVEATLAVAAARVPGLSGQPVVERWAGLYEMTPDGHALLGAVPGRPGLYVLAGASGHGVMHAPALGLLLAETVVHGAARSLDARGLDPGRFAAGAAHEREWL
jgi:sarcosine oxidase subunit beta